MGQDVDSCCRHKSRTVAIDVRFLFEHAVFQVFPFPTCTVKLLSDYFDNKQCGPNKDLPTYNVSIYMRVESSELEKRSGPNMKKISELENV